MLVTALFSMFISNTATTAMMLTFLTPVFQQLPEGGKGVYVVRIASESGMTTIKLVKE